MAAGERKWNQWTPRFVNQHATRSGSQALISSGEGQFLALPRLRSTQPPNAHSELNRHFAKTLSSLSAVPRMANDWRMGGDRHVR
jgi:hypothetical protein